MEKSDIKIHTIFVMSGDLNTSDDELSEALELWKSKFLTNSRNPYLEWWNRIEKADNEGPKPLVKRWANRTKWVIKYAWPMIALAAIGYLSVLSSIYLAVILLPVQAFLFISVASKLHSAVCVGAAYKADKTLKEEKAKATQS